MAFLYPILPQYSDVTKVDPQTVYNDIVTYASELKFLLEQRDIQHDSSPTFRIYTVVSTGEIGRPMSGDVAFAASAGKFRGFVSGTGWVDFN